MKCLFPFFQFVIVICLLLEACHRDVAEGLNSFKCSVDDFITVDANVNCQCNASPEFDRSEANEETVPVLATVDFGLVFFYVVDYDLGCGIFLYNTSVHTIVQTGLILCKCDPYSLNIR
jgi:hypothetical protein